MIAIRADANEKIAMGHVMRCLSIAGQLRAIGQETVFFLSEEYAADYIEKCGFSCICLHNSYLEKEEELGRLAELLERFQIKKLILDSYQVTELYMRGLREKVWLAYLDDENKFYYPADLIINYGLGATREMYADKRYEGTEFLLGSRFCPLRPEFSQEGIPVRDAVERILITTGGTDPFDMVRGLLKRLDKNPVFAEIKKCVVAGKFYPHLDELRELAKQDEALELHHDIPDMCGVMRSCDMAVSASGTTLAELCACGVPTIAFSIADNQIPGVKAYDGAGLLYYAGDVRGQKEIVMERIEDQLDKMARDRQLREQLAKAAKSAVDGQGAGRIAEAVNQEGN